MPLPNQWVINLAKTLMVGLTIAVVRGWDNIASLYIS